MDYAPTLRRLLAGEHLDRTQAAELIGTIMDGSLTAAQGAGLLVALAAKGEHVDEIVGAARAMRERSLHVDHDLPVVVDVVGTGGDGANTINISTMAALVVAACGLPVAKHGNRAASSACGSADVLEAAGLPLDVSPGRSAQMLRAANFAFMFAASYHPAMKNVGPIRRELGVRTVFNILGPLTNPARASIQIVGVAREALVEVVGEVLPGLGVRRGAVVHGAGGIDEVAGHAPSIVYSFDEDGARRWELDPHRYGIDVPLADLVARTKEECRDAFFAILGGTRSPRSEVVALNAALALFTAGHATTMEAALGSARACLASGAALRTFEQAKAIANG